MVLYASRDRMCATEHAPRDPFRVLERRHGLAEIVELGAGVQVERLRVIPPHSEHEIVTVPKNASSYGHYLAENYL